MRSSKFSDTQILAILQEAASGASVPEICARHGISPATWYRWKVAHSDKPPVELRLRRLEAENESLKRLCADLARENANVKAALEQHGG